VFLFLNVLNDVFSLIFVVIFTFTHVKIVKLV